MKARISIMGLLVILVLLGAFLACQFFIIPVTDIHAQVVDDDDDDDWDDFDDDDDDQPVDYSKPPGPETYQGSAGRTDAEMAAAPETLEERLDELEVRRLELLSERRRFLCFDVYSKISLYDRMLDSYSSCKEDPNDCRDYKSCKYNEDGEIECTTYTKCTEDCIDYTNPYEATMAFLNDNIASASAELTKHGRSLAECQVTWTGSECCGYSPCPVGGWQHL